VRPRARSHVLSIAVLFGLLTTGCATRGFVRPSGPATPYPEATAIWDQMTRACGEVSSARAELRVSGRLNGERASGVTVGVAVDASRLAILGRVGGTNLFHAAGVESDVTLLLQRERQVVRGPAADVVEGLAGIRLGPARLLALLSGCVTQHRVVTGAERVGGFARVTTADSVVYLVPQASGWQLAAAEIDGLLVVDFARIDATGRPRELTLRRPPDATIAMRVVEFEPNPALPDELFRVAVPGSFTETPLAAFRAGGVTGDPRNP
jgi:hypothetical protein